jgi:hypothetical protein
LTNFSPGKSAVTIVLALIVAFAFFYVVYRIPYPRTKVNGVLEQQSSVSSQAPPKPPTNVRLASVNLIYYARLGCNAAWNQSCTIPLRIDAPPKRQVCNFVYTISESNNERYVWFGPDKFIPSDSEKPARYTAIQLTIWAEGSGAFWNRWGSVLMLSNVGIEVMDATATNAERQKNKCWVARPGDQKQDR